MSVTRGLARHLSVAILVATIAGAWPAIVRAQDAPDPSGSATFVILVGGTRVGTETLSITRSGSGWIVAGAGRLQPPFDLTTNKFEVTYGGDWQPQQFALEASLRGQPLTINSMFGLTTATSELRQGASRASATHQVSPRAVVLPNNFFAAYEMLAVRLSSAAIGTRIPIYVAPSGETMTTVSQTVTRRISLGDRTLELREFVLTIANPSGAMAVELWVDARGRLARLVMPTSGVVAIREDLATVMAREERARHPRDEDVFIGADGFSLGATITTPATTPTGARMPAVVLVSAPGAQDRDFISYGVPIFGQLAGALADAGYFVVRYDARGVGTSGGRAEAARVIEYSDDVLNVVRWLRRRRDIDPNRVSLVGYGESGPIALLSASREKAIAGVALVAAPGLSGREVTLEQQRLSLGRLPISDPEKANRLALQSRVMDAVLTGNSWNNIPDDVRAQADTLWFKSWLQFDPAATMRRVESPVLIVHGELDRETPVAHASRLESLARARNKAPATHTQVRVVPTLNHLLIPAKTGEVDEYGSLTVRTVSPDVVRTLAEWLGATAIRR